MKPDVTFVNWPARVANMVASGYKYDCMWLQRVAYSIFCKYFQKYGIFAKYLKKM